MAHIQWNVTQPLKKNEIRLFAATWMDLETITLSEVSQIEKINILYHFYVKYYKMIQMNLFTKQKYSHRHRKQTHGYQKGKGQRRDKLRI